MKLKVEMYVRTKHDGIKRVDGLYSKAIFTDTHIRVEYTDILKSSHNIIDLIEVGDYVNGYKVSFKDKDIEQFVQCDYPVSEGTTNHYKFYERGIYSIVTKEQFKNTEYNVSNRK